MRASEVSLVLAAAPVFLQEMCVFLVERGDALPCSEARRHYRFVWGHSHSMDLFVIIISNIYVRI